LKFSPAVDFFICALFKEYWIYADMIGVDFVGVKPLPDTTLWLDSTGLDSTLDVHPLADTTLWLHSIRLNSILLVCSSAYGAEANLLNNAYCIKLQHNLTAVTDANSWTFSVTFTWNSTYRSNP